MNLVKNELLTVLKLHKSSLQSFFGKFFAWFFGNTITRHSSAIESELVENIFDLKMIINLWTHFIQCMPYTPIWVVLHVVEISSWKKLVFTLPEIPFQRPVLINFKLVDCKMNRKTHSNSLDKQMGLLIYSIHFQVITNFHGSSHWLETEIRKKINLIALSNQCIDC